MTRIGYLSCGGGYDPDDDPRLAQDMESELAADVEFFDHPTRGRIRLRDALVHGPGSLPYSPADIEQAADYGDIPTLDGWDPA